MRLWYRLQDGVRHVMEFLDDSRFDLARRVRTAGDVPLWKAGIEQAGDSERYQPARPWQVRHAVGVAAGRMPRGDAAAYTYVDLGSGKGRTLFVAAEWPFREVVGVEFSRLLHERAAANARAYRSRRRRCGAVRSVHADATEFAFPDGPLVVYLFNPFGAVTMGRVFDRLAASLEREPRHVIVLLLWPKHGDVVARVPGMSLFEQTQWLEAFEAHPPGGVGLSQRTNQATASSR